MIDLLRRFFGYPKGRLYVVDRPVAPFDAEPQSADLVAELRRWGSIEVGTPFVQANAWGPPLTKLLNAAADEIERQRPIGKRKG